VDFVATIGLLEGGLEEAEAIRERISERIVEWNSDSPLDGKNGQ
jgi:hypothetical protein